MSKINRLPAQTEARLPTIRDEWIAAGLATGPCDRDEVESAVDAVYAVAGLAPPAIKVWLRSPMEGVVGSAALNADQVQAQVQAQVRNQVRNQVRDQVRDQVQAQVQAQVRNQVRNQVGAQVWDQVWDQVRDQVEAQVWAQVGAQVGDQIGFACWGQHDAWLSFYEPFVGLVGGADRIRPLHRMRACGWWWPKRGAVILTERPTAIHLDGEGRLHSAAGLALEYADGWGVAAYRGTRIPPGWVQGSPPGPAEALRWKNVEQRRAACELLGWSKILAELNATEVDADPDASIGTLLRADLPDSPGEQFLRVRCGTGRDFVLPVPPGCKTALEANAWTYGLDAAEYRPEVRT